MCRLTDEEVWLRSYFAHVGEGSIEVRICMAEEDLSSFRKRFPAEAAAEQELVVEWAQNAAGSWYDTCNGYKLSVYFVGITGLWCFSICSGVKHIAEGYSYNTAEQAKSAAEAALRKELGNAT